MSKSQNLRAEHMSGVLLSTGNLRTVLRGNTQGSPFSTWSTHGHRIILGGREPESAFLKLPQLRCCTESRIFPRDHGLRRGDSTATLQMRATERAAFRAPSRVLSTRERAAASKAAGGPPAGGQPVVNFGLYANVQVEEITKSKTKTISIKGPVCGEPGSPYLLQQVHQSQSLREQLGQEQRRLGLKEEHFPRRPNHPQAGFLGVFFLFLFFGFFFCISIQSRLQIRVHFFLRNMKTIFNSCTKAKNNIQ